MKAGRIFDLLKTAMMAKQNGGNFIPCFVGESGIGKTEMVYQFGEAEGYNVIPIIVSQYDSADFIGSLYKKEIQNGETRSDFALPMFWPTEGKHIIFLDELNRGREELQAPLLQLIQEGRLGKDYRLPKECIIACAINPDNDVYGTQSMNTAMLNRLSMFNINFDLEGFIKYIDGKYHEDVVNFIKSGLWTYYKADVIGNDANAKYISSRTWKQLSDIKLSDPKLKEPGYHKEVCYDMLGGNVGEIFHKFCFEESPVLVSDLIKDKKEAMKRLKKYSNTKNYNGASISATVESVAEHFSTEKSAPIGFDLMVDICKIINADQAVLLITKCLQSKNNTLSFDDFIKKIKSETPELVEAMMTGLSKK